MALVLDEDHRINALLDKSNYIYMDKTNLGLLFFRFSPGFLNPLISAYIFRFLGRTWCPK